jgi:hypothetical protein
MGGEEEELTQRTLRRRGCREANPRAQPGMAVPQEGSVFHAGWGGIRWRERDDEDECIDTGGE